MHDPPQESVWRQALAGSQMVASQVRKIAGVVRIPVAIIVSGVFALQRKARNYHFDEFVAQFINFPH